MTAQRTSEQVLEQTADPAWILDQQGFDPLRDSSRESRFAISNGLGLNPQLADGWQSLAFSVQWRGRHISVSIDGSRKAIQAALASGEPMIITVGEEQHQLGREAPLVIDLVVKCLAKLPANDGMQRRKSP